MNLKKLKWLMYRMRAMSPTELGWRVREKLTETYEKKEYYTKHLPVTQIALGKELLSLQPDVSRLNINWDNQEYLELTELDLFGIYRENEWRMKWNAGFQTANEWDETAYSPELSIGQREEIGDIRTNWELNRHYQFAALAKTYYVTGNVTVLEDLKRQFEDWNRHNLFLHGAEWTSAMELAIRINSWIYTLAFLQKAFEKWNRQEASDIIFLQELSHGILGMTEFVMRHRSRGSSANNHLIVELYAVAMSGILYAYPKWEEAATRLLTKELFLQNARDGVNLEMSTHYQAFVMEAYGLLAGQLRDCTPKEWIAQLKQMSHFLADCQGAFGETAIFGDDDSGKILDLNGRMERYYDYVLALCGQAVKERYTEETQLPENLCWLWDDRTKEQYRSSPLYEKPNASCYREGGYSFLRSKDQKVFIAVDHAALGFGTIAAHGHADALSIQAFLKGTPVLTDPGTWNYHLSGNLRNSFRSTKWHNTVGVADQNQSEMLGPFLWGKRAQTELLDCQKKPEKVILKAQTQYGTIRHTRTLRFDYKRTLWIEDCVTGIADGQNAVQNFSLGPECCLSVVKNGYRLTCPTGESELTGAKTESWQEAEYSYSAAYNHMEPSKRIFCTGQGKNGSVLFRTKIEFKAL